MINTFPKRHIAGFILLSVIATLSFIAFGHYLSMLLANIVVGSREIMYDALLWMVLAFVVFISMRALYKYVTAKTAHKRINAIAGDIVENVDDESNKESESLMNALFVHLDKYRSYEEVFIPALLNTTVKLVLIITALSAVHLNSALILVFTAPFIPLYYILVGLKTRDESAKLAGDYDNMGTLFLNIVRGKDTIKNTASEDTVKARLEEDNKSFVEDTMAILKYAFQSTLMLEFITILGIGLIALEIGLQIIVFENITFYAAFFALVLAPEFYNALKVLGVEFHNGRLAEGHYEKVGEWLNKEVKDTNYRGETDDHSVELDTLTLSVADKTLLSNVDVNIPKRGLTAITGPSGAGKSTLLRAILGLKPPESGSIRVNTTEIGYISDQVYFSDTTIYDYLSDGKFNEAEVKDILTKLNMEESIVNLKDGIHTEIVNHNIPLSGGEVVRLKMARVLLRQPSLILMDEPTEFLDAETENLVLNYLQQLKNDCAVIAVVHRRKLLTLADVHYKLVDQMLVRDD